MAVLVNKNTRVLIQGITGRQAHLNTLYMRSYGTQIVAGVTPGKGGLLLENEIPIYNTVHEALARHPEINASLIYVPPRAVKQAALEAIGEGVPLVVITTERCPRQDVMEVIAHARKHRVRVVGPNSIGIITPGECVMGLIGGRLEIARECFKSGPVGVMSRSGGQTTTVCYYLSQAGLGQSTAVGIGGDAFNGTSFRDLLELFQKDPGTAAVVAFGEVGTAMEEEAADFIKKGGFQKPFISYVAGRFVEEGVRYGHAGALISGGVGDVKTKIDQFRKSKVKVLEHLDEVAQTVQKLLQ